MERDGGDTGTRKSRRSIERVSSRAKIKEGERKDERKGRRTGSQRYSGGIYARVFEKTQNHEAADESDESDRELSNALDGVPSERM